MSDDVVSSDADKEFTLAMAQRYLQVIELLRTANPGAILRPIFNSSDAVTLKYMDGLALCIAYGSSPYPLSFITSRLSGMMVQHQSKTRGATVASPHPPR